MSNYTTIAETEEIPSGERKRIEIDGQRISIFNIDNTYYAINDTCPHIKKNPEEKSFLGIFN